MNTEDFVTYEQAVALKKLGFDQSCTHYYECGELTCQYDTVSNDGGYPYDISIDDLMCSVNKNCPNTDVFDAPTISQARKWLRTEKHLIVLAVPSPFMCNEFKTAPFLWLIYDEPRSMSKMSTPDYGIHAFFETPEMAISAGITECLNMLLENN